MACLLCLSNVNAQTLKTYSGKFLGGQATYTYRDNPEGGRIYEGKFTFTRGNLHVEGNYKNDKKDGLWIYTNNVETLKANYVNGVRDGSYVYHSNAENHIPETNASLTLKDNRIVGTVNASGNVDWSLGKLTGYCNEDGYADGLWVFDTTPYGGNIITRCTYKNGYIIKYTDEDVTTGDVTNNRGEGIAANVHTLVRRDALEVIDRGMVTSTPRSVTRAGTPQTEEKANEVLSTAEVAPQYPGGSAAMFKYISDNMQYPSQAEQNGVQGRVMVQFVVRKDGTITDVTVIRGVSEELDAEAVRLVKSMPKWIPGKQGGQVVNVSYTLPVMFRL